MGTLTTNGAVIAMNTQYGYDVQLAGVQAMPERFKNVVADPVARTITFDVIEAVEE